MNINISELQRLKSRSEDINSRIIDNFTSMRNTLNEICDNVRSSSLTSANQNLVNALVELSNKIGASLPHLSTFLGTQMTKYSESNTQAKSSLDSLVATINTKF